MLLGNPLSGLTSAPEVLPRGWGAFGQWLPQEANGTLLRSTAYFDGAGATTAILVLTCWALVGAMLIIVAGLRQRGSDSGHEVQTQPAVVPAPATVPVLADGYFRDASGEFRGH
jgi:hypothetical protein